MLPSVPAVIHCGSEQLRARVEHDISSGWVEGACRGCGVLLRGCRVVRERRRRPGRTEQSCGIRGRDGRVVRAGRVRRCRRQRRDLGLWWERRRNRWLGGYSGIRRRNGGVVGPSGVGRHGRHGRHGWDRGNRRNRRNVRQRRSGWHRRRRSGMRDPDRLGDVRSVHQHLLLRPMRQVRNEPRVHGDLDVHPHHLHHRRRCSVYFLCNPMCYGALRRTARLRCVLARHVAGVRFHELRGSLPDGVTRSSTGANYVEDQFF
jgi:hypothetical protein